MLAGRAHHRAADGCAPGKKEVIERKRRERRANGGVTGDHRDFVLGEGLGDQRSQQLAGRRRDLRRLDHRAIAGGERRRERHQRERERVVPRRDDADDAERLRLDVRAAQAHRQRDAPSRADVVMVLRHVPQAPGAPPAFRRASTAPRFRRRCSRVELFGHERGAFTGAVAQTVGRFQSRGSRHLVPRRNRRPAARTAAEAARASLQEQVERLRSGGRQRVRSMCGDCGDQPESRGDGVSERAFRADLFYRMNVFPIRVPPLRERVEDIPLLANYFLRRVRRAFGQRSRLHRGRQCRLAAPFVAGQRARASERRRARRRLERGFDVAAARAGAARCACRDIVAHARAGGARAHRGHLARHERCAGRLGWRRRQAGAVQDDADLEDAASRDLGDERYFYRGESITCLRGCSIVRGNNDAVAVRG